MVVADRITIAKIIGCLIHKPDILIDDGYKLVVEDFDERFHKIVFSAIRNLVFSGASSIDPIDIDNYLSSYEKQYKIFNDNNGFDYLMQSSDLADLKSFDYYYNRLKKFSLLRTMEASGMDTTDIYDESVIDITLREKMIAEFEKMSIDDILDQQEQKLVDIKQQFTQDEVPQAQAGKGLSHLIESFNDAPEMGAPLQSKILNTIVRGARLKKLYMRSSITGGGKTRLSVADACGISVPYFYDLEKKRWKKTGFAEPTLFISTETEIDECQTQMVAFVSGVEEWKILDGKYDKDEGKRIKKAIQYIAETPLWIVQLANFNIENIETIIKEYKLKHKVKYVFFDYLFTSVKLLTEISQKTKGMRLREDNVLYIFSERLKFLCNKLNICIVTATQLNSDWKDAKDADMNLLRGSKAIADKIDAGMIVLPATKKDLEALRPILHKGFFKEPNMCYHIYKVRRGKLTRVRLWVYVDLSTCRTYDCFVTNNDYELIRVDATNIEKILEENEADLHSISEEEFEKETNQANTMEEERHLPPEESFVW